jgi:hypothetical protein
VGAKDDLTRGFTQLAAEMTEMGDCYGVITTRVITTGNIWQFAQLSNTLITQDLNLYRVPADRVHPSFAALTLNPSSRAGEEL